MTPVDIRKEFVAEFRGLCHRWNPWDVWSDWLVCASSSIYNAIHKDPAVEEEYLRAASRYNADEMAAMSRLLGMTVQALDLEVHDFLGGIFHELEMHNEARGQFFTPFEVCRMMAAISIPEPPRPGRLLRVGEPACGSGAMVLAFHAELSRQDPSIQARVYYHLADLDDRAFRMAYIQCSLCGLSAEVARGNTLSLEYDRTWRTPGYYLHDTPTRMRVDSMMRGIHGDHHAPADATPAPPVASDAPPVQGPQDLEGRPGPDRVEAPDPGPGVPPVPADLILPAPGGQFSLFG